MASLQRKGDAWYCQFLYLGKRHTFTVGPVPESEALQWKARCEHLLTRIKQGLLEVPPGVPIADFILFDGKPPVDPALAARKQTVLHELTEAYLDTHGNGAIESNTLTTARIHLAHIQATLGKRFLLSGLTLGRLQDHIKRRQDDVSPVTIKKEIDTFRSAWNWALRMKWVEQPFPSSGLVYPKTDEKLPFMTTAEIKRRIRAGADEGALWECLYLDAKEIRSLLTHVKARKAPAWVYPMLASAAYTGARRSELVRARMEDVDLKSGVLTIREKKRARGSRTTRRVPISAPLAAVLKEWMSRRSAGPNLFAASDRTLSVQAVQKAFGRVLKDSKWSAIKGWNVLRHSFISACAAKGIDQRFIDEWVGHCSEAMRLRYRHLYPSVQAAAISRVFT